MDQTIVALATTPGEASINIVRLSGKDSFNIIQDCFRPKNLNRWNNNVNFTLHLGKFFDGDVYLDEVLISRMMAPYSYTGEDVYEINCHGGRLVANRILEACFKRGARLATPGEYTKRAFLNGKVDLIQAEAIIDLITSKTELAADQALIQMGGSLSEMVFNLREEILECLAFIEAGIDFPEDDVEDLDRVTLLNKVNSANKIVMDLIAGSKTGKILRNGLLTVIVGKPNVGKSSLLNALLREERAIVTNIPGTTRDEIRESVNIGGILLQLVDTAGIRESEDLVERLGIERTWKVLDDADLILLMVEAGSNLTEDERKIVNTYSSRIIVLINKIDKMNDSKEYQINLPQNVKFIPFSVLERKGYSELESIIKEKVFKDESYNLKDPMISNLRHIEALERCNVSLKSAISTISKGLPWDIISIDIRNSLKEVSEVTGHNVQETLLEDIFSRFCIGK